MYSLISNYRGIIPRWSFMPLGGRGRDMSMRGGSRGFERVRVGGYLLCCEIRRLVVPAKSER